MPDLESEARETLLKAIAAAADGATSPTGLLKLAEAYAWVVSPGQPHGSQLTAT
jgi:hypothetical protein